MKRIVAAICVIVVVISVMLIVRTGCQGTAVKLNVEPDRCAGALVATETAKLLKDQGHVVVIARVNNDPPDAQGEAQVEGFKKEMKQHGGIQIDAVLPVGPSDAYPLANGLFWTFFMNAVKAYPNANAIVSLVGVPVGEQGAPPPPVDASTLPKVVALSSERISFLADPIKKGIVTKVIFLRRLTAWEPSRKVKSCQEATDLLYAIVDKENYAESAPKLAERPPASP